MALLDRVRLTVQQPELAADHDRLAGPEPEPLGDVDPGPDDHHLEVDGELPAGVGGLAEVDGGGHGQAVPRPGERVARPRRRRGRSVGAVVQDGVLPEVGALALEPDQPALVDQDVDGQPDGVAGDPVLALQFALDREGGPGGEFALGDPAAQIGGEALVFGGLGGAPGDCHPSECSEGGDPVSADSDNVDPDRRRRARGGRPGPPVHGRRRPLRIRTSARPTGAKSVRTTRSAAPGPWMTGATEGTKRNQGRAAISRTPLIVGITSAPPKAAAPRTRVRPGDGRSKSRTAAGSRPPPCRPAAPPGRTSAPRPAPRRPR